ncbi:AtpZ/AtpI family protein [Candidatus Gottesmanbacteria bacterium]|nr:AtpZ/AtpI family protein [Candidatus Gottesmanbacteria bacterium]
MKDGARERFDVVMSSETTQFRRKQEPEKKDGSDAWYYLGLVGQIGFAIALPIAAGGIGGAYIDTWLGTQPRATLLLLLLGVVVSLVGFFSVIKEVSRNPKNF